MVEGGGAKPALEPNKYDIMFLRVDIMHRKSLLLVSSDIICAGLGKKMV